MCHPNADSYRDLTPKQIYMKNYEVALQILESADDTSIIYANKNLYNREQIVNSELCNVSQWLLANKLTLNFKNSN